MSLIERIGQSDWGRRVGLAFDTRSIPEGLPVDPNVPRVRGLALLAALAYVRDRGGRDLMKDVLSKLTEQEVALLIGGSEKDTGIHARAWYPLSLQSHLRRAIDLTVGDGDNLALHEVGAFMANRDIKRVFRPFLKVGKPGWIFELAPRLWRTYQSHGTWEFDRTPVSLIATLKGRPLEDDVWCAMFHGWAEAALEMSGAINVEGSHPACAGLGAPHCVYTVRWELP